MLQPSFFRLLKSLQPTNWFHFIVNLSLNYQCNARSGTTYESAHLMEDCGFKMPT